MNVKQKNIHLYPLQVHCNTNKPSPICFLAEIDNDGIKYEHKTKATRIFHHLIVTGSTAAQRPFPVYSFSPHCTYNGANYEGKNRGYKVS